MLTRIGKRASVYNSFLLYNQSPGTLSYVKNTILSAKPVRNQSFLPKASFSTSTERAFDYIKSRDPLNLALSAVGVMAVGYGVYGVGRWFINLSRVPQEVRDLENKLRFYEIDLSDKIRDEIAKQMKEQKNGNNQKDK